MTTCGFILLSTGHFRLNFCDFLVSGRHDDCDKYCHERKKERKIEKKKKKK
jgi:hypothetical protein